MAENTIDNIHDLDSVAEYFDFRLKGHIYRFRHMTADELTKLQEVQNDFEKMKELIFGFITKVDPESPDFSETSKQMTVKHWKKFNKMIGVEMGNEDGSN